MNPDQRELTIEESIQQVMRALPPVVRDYVQQGRYTEVAKILMMKYDLHVDQGAILERELMLLVMGVESPTEFIQSLATEVHLDDKTIDGMIVDINDLIFVPLREEEMKSGGVQMNQSTKPAPAAWKASVPPPVRSMPAQASVPTYAYAKPKQSSPLPPSEATKSAAQYFHLENKIPPKVRPSSESIYQPAPETRPSPPVIPKTAPQMPMLEDHEEPHIELKQALAQVVPAQVASPRAPEIRQVDKAEIPPNLPGVLVSSVSPVSAPPPAPTIPPAPPVPAASTPVAPIKEYVVDPYREPIGP